MRPTAQAPTIHCIAPAAGTGARLSGAAKTGRRGPGKLPVHVTEWWGVGLTQEQQQWGPGGPSTQWKQWKSSCCSHSSSGEGKGLACVVAAQGGLHGGAHEI